MTGLIAWLDFSWEAFATLTTGVLAVGAAVFVGKRQLQITAQQASLQDFALRNDLFDRRYQVYEAVENLICVILREADVAPPEVKRNFIVAMGQCKFLFSQPVCEAVNEIWKKLIAFEMLAREMKSKMQSSGHYGEGNPEKESAALNWFSDRLDSLPSLFDEMKLAK